MDQATNNDPFSFSFRILVLRPENRLWTRFTGISFNFSWILHFSAMINVASYPPSYSFLFRMAKKCSMGRIWGQLRGLASLGMYLISRPSRRSKLKIGIVTGYQVRPEVILHFSMCLIRERLQAGFKALRSVHFTIQSMFR